MGNRGVIENSTDFIGLHFPSVGAGFGVLIIVTIFVFLLICCGRKCWSYSSSRPRRNRSNSQQQQQPFSQMPYPFYPINQPVLLQPQLQQQPHTQAIEMEPQPPRNQAIEMETFFHRLNAHMDRIEFRHPRIRNQTPEPGFRQHDQRSTAASEIDTQDTSIQCDRFQEIP